MIHLAVLAAALFASPLTPVEPVAFERAFIDSTLRVDTYHVGNATEEMFTLDRVVRQQGWAGSRKNLTDPFGVGRYVATVSDPATRVVLFSKAYDSYFGEYRTTVPAESGVRRTFHESVLIPCPRKTVRFAIALRQRDGSLRELFAADVDPAATSVVNAPLDKGVTVVEAHHGGDPHAVVDVAIVAEGYTAAEEKKFRSDLARFVKIFFGQEPFASRKERFNIRGVFRPSQDSGCSEPSWGEHRNTAVGATFDSLGSERYMLTEENRRLRDLAAHVPYDALYIMVNTTRYGGGGIYNLYCTFTADNQWSPYVFIHEFGHHFAGLADEYYTSSVAYSEFYPKGAEPDAPNVTALLNPATLKWRSLVTPGTPLPTPWEKAEFDTMDRAYQKVREELNAKIAAAKRAGAPRADVEKLQDESERLSKEHAGRVDAYLAKSRFVGQVGAFEGAGYAAEGLYRPALDCIMFTKGSKPFCRVCQQALVRVIEHYGE